MLKKIAYFNSNFSNSNFTENEDGSITKSALLLVEGEHKCNKGNGHKFDADYIVEVAKNTNKALNNGTFIPVLKDHQKSSDAEIGEIGSLLTARVITEDDLPNKKHTHLLGKMGLFCDGVVLKAKDVVERVKSGLNKTISPGINLAKRQLAELSVTPTPAILGLSMYSEGSSEMDGIYTLDDADAMSQDEEELKEEFEDLSYKFYCVIKNIMKNGEELGEEADMMVEKAFADYEMRLRNLFGLTGEIPEEDATVADTQRNGYSLQQAPGMVQNDYAPYSLYEVDSAEFAGWFGMKPLQNIAQSYGKGLGMVGTSAKRLWNTGNVGKSTANLRKYFTRKASNIQTGTTGRIMDWGRVGKAAGAVAGTGAAGYGAYRLGRAGLGAVGIGRKEEQKPAPWYRFGR